jgi:hypothetical protein
VSRRISHSMYRGETSTMSFGTTSLQVSGSHLHEFAFIPDAFLLRLLAGYLGYHIHPFTSCSLIIDAGNSRCSGRDRHTVDRLFYKVTPFTRLPVPFPPFYRYYSTGKHVAFPGCFHFCFCGHTMLQWTG